MWNINIFFKCNLTQEVFFTTHQYISTCAPVCIPRSFLLIDVCNQGKNLCSPCIIYTPVYKLRQRSYRTSRNMSIKIKEFMKPSPLTSKFHSTTNEVKQWSESCTGRWSWQRYLKTSNWRHPCRADGGRARLGKTLVKEINPLKPE